MALWAGKLVYVFGVVHTFVCNVFRFSYVRFLSICFRVQNLAVLLANLETRELSFFVAFHACSSDGRNAFHEDTNPSSLN